MKFEFFTTRHFFKSKKDNLFISKLLVISILTVTLAITIPIVVISVINGFHSEIQEKTLGVNFDLQISNKYGELSSHQKLLAQLSQHPDVELAVPFFESEAVIKDRLNDEIRVVTIRAFNNEDILKNLTFTRYFKIVHPEDYDFFYSIHNSEQFDDDDEEEDEEKLSEEEEDPNEKEDEDKKDPNKEVGKIVDKKIDFNDKSDIANSITKKNNLIQNIIPKTSGKKEDIPFQINRVDGIVIGQALSKALTVTKGDKIELLIPYGDDVQSISSDKIKKFTITDIYNANSPIFNLKMVFINFKAIAEIFDLRNMPSHIGVNLKAKASGQKIISLLQKENPDLRITITEKQQQFKDFAQQKKIMALLLYFLSISAFLTIFIALHVVVMDKRKEIGILMAFGSKKTSIQKIFVLEGLIISFMGLLFGNLLGYLITLSLTEIVKFVELLVNTPIDFFNIYIAKVFELSKLPHFYIFDPKVFYMQNFPYRFNYFDIAIQCIGAILVSLFAANFPAKKASNQQAAESLRFR